MTHRNKQSNTETKIFSHSENSCKEDEKCYDSEFVQISRKRSSTYFKRLRKEQLRFLTLPTLYNSYKEVITTKKEQIKSHLIKYGVHFITDMYNDNELTDCFLTD